MPFDLTIPSIITLALIIILSIWIIRLEVKLRRLTIGKNSKNLEDSMTYVSERLTEFSAFRKQAERYLTSVERRLKKSVQAVDTVRFNPWKGEGVGGDQSFASAFINEEGKGVVISSMFGRDRISVYAKPISNFVSTYELSAEEKNAIEKAKTTIGE